MSGEGERSCRFQHWYLVDREEGAAEACASPHLCKAPGCWDGWHTCQSKLLPVPLLYTLGSSAQGGDAIIPPPNGEEKMGLWSCRMASISSRACL